MAKVICPGCRGQFHETTDLYRDDTITSGDMLRLVEPYRTEYCWTSFPEVPDMVWANLDCPQCGMPYCNDQGRVKLAEAHVPTTAREVGLVLEFNKTLDDMRIKKEEAEEEAAKNEEMMIKAVELWDGGRGVSVNQIAIDFGVSRGKINRLIRAYSQANN